MGSGCIGIGVVIVFENVFVDLLDIFVEVFEVVEFNIELYELGEWV